MASLEDSVWAACCARYALDPDDPDERRNWRAEVVRDFHRLLDRLVDLGCAHRSTPAGDGARLALTPLGTWCVRSRLRAQGRPAPLVGELSRSDADTLLFALVEEYTIETSRAEVALWLAARGTPVPGSLEVPETPAAFLTRIELSDALRRIPLRTRKAAMLGVLTRTLPEGHAFAESLLDDPDLGPLAVQDLLSTGHRSLDGLPPRESLLGLAESLAQLLEMGGPRALVTQFAEHDPQATLNVLSGVARSDHPHADRIVRAVAPGFPRPHRNLGERPRHPRGGHHGGPGRHPRHH